MDAVLSHSPRSLALKYQLAFYNLTSFLMFLIFPLSFVFPFLGEGGQKQTYEKRGGCCRADLRFEKC